MQICLLSPESWPTLGGQQEPMTVLGGERLPSSALQMALEAGPGRLPRRRTGRSAKQGRKQVGVGWVGGQRRRSLEGGIQVRGPHGHSTGTAGPRSLQKQKSWRAHLFGLDLRFSVLAWSSLLVGSFWEPVRERLRLRVCELQVCQGPGWWAARPALASSVWCVCVCVSTVLALKSFPAFLWYLLSCCTFAGVQCQ